MKRIQKITAALRSRLSSIVTRYISGIIFLAISQVSSAQLPQIEWKDVFGGTSDEVGYQLQQTTDGGFVVFGYSRSINNDLEGIEFPRQGLAIKYDANGHVEWRLAPGGSGNERSFYGEELESGGYLMSIESQTDDGDVPVNYGEQDFACFRINESGLILSVNVYGGTLHDHPSCIRATTDGGFILAGGSKSNDGVLSGHHGSTEYFDAWALKGDSAGNVVWSKSIGGTRDDFLRYAEPLNDGSYVFVGESFSEDGDISEHKGSNSTGDILVIKLDASGNLLWEKTYGGKVDDIGHRIIELADGGLAVIGQTASIDGDVGNPHGGDDFWLLMLDSDGNLLWEKTYGGSLQDVARSIEVTSDGGFLIGGLSASSDGDVSANNGGNDFWIVKTDAAGNIQWAANYGGTLDDNGFVAVETSDGGYAMTGASFSSDGDVSEHYPPDDLSDIWTIRLAFPGDVTIETLDLGASDFCPGEALLVEYAIGNSIFNEGNVFTAQLSNASGDFSNPFNIGSITSTSSGEIQCFLPSSTKGLAYRVRVVSSSPPATGSDNGSGFSINCPAPTLLSQSDVTANSALLAWNTIACANKYFVNYRKSGTSVWTQTTSTSSTTTLTNLQPLTQYDWRVKTQCAPGGKGSSAFSQIKNFTTLPARLQSETDYGIASISLFPNPAQASVTVAFSQLDEPLLDLRISDITGGVVLHPEIPAQSIGDSQIMIPVETLPPGFYSVNIFTSNTSYHQPLVIAR